MALVRDVSTFLWILVIYIFARYAVVDLDMPIFDMNHIIWAHNELFFITTKDMFIIVGLFLLFIEIWKAADPKNENNLSEVIISFLVSVAFLTIFLVWDKAHNVTFFILMIMSFLDSIGGVIISVSVAKKDISFNG